MSQLILKIETRASVKYTEKELIEMIRKHREGMDNSLPSWCRACKDTAHDIHTSCYFRLEETADFRFQAVCIFL